MCINFFKDHPCREGGQKEANVEKYEKPIENVSVSPVPLDSPILQHKLVQLTFSSKFHLINSVEMVLILGPGLEQSYTGAQYWASHTH